PKPEKVLTSTPDSAEKSASKPTRLPKRPLNDEEIKDIAYDRLVGYKKSPYRPEEIKVLATRYGRDPAVITKAIQSALDKRLISVEVHKSTVVRIKSTESELLAKFKGLRRALVIQSTQTDPSDQPKDPVQDRLHTNLGKVTAEFLATSELL